MFGVANTLADKFLFTPSKNMQKWRQVAGLLHSFSPALISTAFKRKFSLVLDIHFAKKCSFWGVWKSGREMGEAWRSQQSDWHLTCRQTCWLCLENWQPGGQGGDEYCPHCRKSKSCTKMKFIKIFSRHFFGFSKLWRI